MKSFNGWLLVVGTWAIFLELMDIAHALQTIAKAAQ